jgi:NAD(P)-dependent dehydrogenase (short-subunit alcohol dehydrogenase family)
VRDLAGRAAVVTGGGNGLGRGIAVALAEAGMRVVVADIDAAAAEGVAVELRTMGVQSVAVPVDVTDPRSVEALADAAFDRMGAVDLLCNNAGVAVLRPLGELTPEDWDLTLSVNLLGAVYGVQAFLPRMSAQPGEKHLLNTISNAALNPRRYQAPYTTSKLGLIGLSEAVAAERDEHGVDVTLFFPGPVATGMARTALDRGRVSPVFPIDAALAAPGIDPVEAGRIARAAIVENRRYVTTDDREIPTVEARCRVLLEELQRPFAAAD